jgi:hypothetical protein
MVSKRLFVKCKTCGKDISSNASACPSCGAKQKKLTMIHWIGIVLGVLILIVIINSPDKSNETDSQNTDKSAKSTSSKTVVSINKPENQIQFEGVISKYITAYKRAKNELQKSAIRSSRRAELGKIINNFEIHSWTGTIKELSTNSEGKAILTIRITPNIEVKTWNNALSDIVSNTLIEQNTKVYNQLMKFTIGQLVYFSGSLFDSGKDYFTETSMTEEGAMVSPEFLVKFTNVSEYK